jgi:methionyl-tRNA synthetase
LCYSEPISQIGEFLRMKTVVVEEGGLSVEGDAAPMCDQCGKQLESAEQQASHAVNCPGPPDIKESGHFACDVCGKPFKRKEHLFQHRKLHTG